MGERKNEREEKKKKEREEREKKKCICAREADYVAMICM